MRIALDTSVLVAAHISRAGVCAEMLEDVLLHHELVTSQFILEELGRKLLEEFNFPKREADQVAAQLAFQFRHCGIIQEKAVRVEDIRRKKQEIAEILPFQRRI